MSLESDIKNIVESIGLQLYDTGVISEGGETIYRVSVIGEGGTSMEQCVKATHLISPLLDVTPPVHSEYRLEVSSPGIERKLKTLENFRLSIGENVALSTVTKEKYRGKLLCVDGNNIVIGDSEVGETAVVFQDISKAKTFFEW